MKVALDRPGKFSRSEQNFSAVPPKYASARRFFARLASETFFTCRQNDFFNNLLEAEFGPFDTIPPQIVVSPEDPA